MIIDGIDYLFHYTTIEKLALILKNKTIRLNSLTNMDDLQESRAKDLKNLGRFFFASSWTDDKTESIPMWNMYTRMDAGVRIGLPKNPFVRHGTDTTKVNLNFDGYKDNKTGLLDTFLDFEKLINEGVYSTQAWKGDILRKIEYTDDLALLEPQIVSFTEDKVKINAELFGKYKNRYWEFQKEWRYILWFIPSCLDPDPYKLDRDFSIAVNRMARDLEAAPFDYYDLDLRDDALAAMKITPSPKLTAGNYVLLEALLEKYNSKAKIEKSELLGLI